MAPVENGNGDKLGDDLVGQTLDRRYLVEKVIGLGGFGTVYSATHAHTRDKLAIKVLRANVAEDPTVVQRFRREATLTSQLKHPNTVSVIDFGEMDDGRLYLVMPFLEGRTLTDLLRDEAPVDAHRLVRIAVQVLKSLDEAHSKGLVHRDLKPDNIFLQDLHGEADFVRVLDFGIARSLDSNEQELTRTGTVMGTPKYMSPEQATGKKADARADLYALGVILFEALSGVTPLMGDTPLATIFRRATEDAPSVSEMLMLPTPQGLCEAVLTAMARDPARRFATAAAMTAALEAGVRTDVRLPARATAPGAPQPLTSTVQYRGVDEDTMAVDLSAAAAPPPPPPATTPPRSSPLRAARPQETRVGNAPGAPSPPRMAPPPGPPTASRAVAAPVPSPAAPVRPGPAPAAPPPPPVAAPRAQPAAPASARASGAVGQPVAKTSSLPVVFAVLAVVILGGVGAWLALRDSSGSAAAGASTRAAGDSPAASDMAAAEKAAVEKAAADKAAADKAAAATVATEKLAAERASAEKAAVDKAAVEAAAAEKAAGEKPAADDPTAGGGGDTPAGDEVGAKDDPVHVGEGGEAAADAVKREDTKPAAAAGDDTKPALATRAPPAKKRPRKRRPAYRPGGGVARPGR